MRRVMNEEARRRGGGVYRGNGRAVGGRGGNGGNRDATEGH
jgi:hypothetical protein